MKIDDNSGSGVVIFYPHERIHSGRSFVSTYKTPDLSPLADNASLNFLIIPRAIIHFVFLVSGNNDIETLFYENTTASNNGTQLSVVGLNRAKSYASEATTWRGPTITNDGDLLETLFSSWSVNLPYPRGSESEWILKANVNYLLRVTNRAGATQPIGVLLQWYQGG